MSKPKRKPAINFQRVALTLSRSGQPVHRSGQYGLFELDGTRHGDTEATFIKGTTFGPTPEPHLLWGLVDQTHHKGDAPDDATP